ncbi:hypothetical protein MP638_003752 [Amoeboaphelidium occidentale]|nr:hypothetical protein MP638_003752 [Amoeboaphelidium occidentale]
MTENVPGASSEKAQDRDNIYAINPYKKQFYNRLVKLAPFNILANCAPSDSKFRPFLEHLPIQAFSFFAIIALFTFGPGFQPISAFVLPALLVFIGYTRSTPHVWQVLVFAWPAVSIGTFFAYAGFYSQNWPWNDFNTIYMIPTAFILGFGMIVVALLDRFVADFCQLMLPVIEIFFAFPMMWSGFWCFLSRVSPIGDYFSWGYALAFLDVDQLTLASSWAVGSIAGGCILSALFVTCSLYIVRRYCEIYLPQPPDNIKTKSIDHSKLKSENDDLKFVWIHSVTVAMYIAFLLFTFGGIYRTFGPDATMFFQNPLAEIAPQTVKISCLIDGSLNSTITHLQTTGSRSKIVLWSEGSQNIQESREGAFLQRARDISSVYDVYLGLAYTVTLNSSRDGYTTRNMFTLIAPPTQLRSPATITLTQQKMHPIPKSEQDTEPGDLELKIAETPYGRIGAAIGIDFNFKDLDSLYAQGVDIVLHPSSAWGATGFYNAMINRQLAVEYGFTHVTCAKNGVSGVFDQFYRILVQQMTIKQGESFVYDVPNWGHRWTLYRFLPDYVGILTIAVALFWFLFLIGWFLVRLRRNIERRSSVQVLQTEEPKLESVLVKEEEEAEQEMRDDEAIAIEQYGRA